MDYLMERKSTKIELISPWSTTLTKEEKLHANVDKLRVRKDYSVESMPPVISYTDNGKNVVIDGATRVEVSRINKKMVPSITISKEFYHKLKDTGLIDHEIADAVYTHNRHERVLRETAPKVTIYGMIHRNSLIPVSTIVQNTEAFRAMAKMFKSKELAKAIEEAFGIVEAGDIEKAAVGSHRAQIGEIREWSGEKYQKTVAGWIPVKKQHNAKTEDQPKGKDGKVVEPEKKRTFKPEELERYARQTSEVNLQSMIKNSDNPKLREAAHIELDRRLKKEHVQEPENKVEAKKPEPKKGSAEEGIKKVFESISEGAKNAGVFRTIERFNKKEDVVFKNPEAIKAAKASEFYNTEEQKDGSLKVLGIKNPDTGEWVGKEKEEKHIKKGYEVWL